MTVSFSATSRHDGPVAVITLDGVLDALTAPAFRQEVERVSELAVEHLVLDVRDMDYLSSGGLRMLGYARQKLPAHARIALVGANDNVQRTIRLVGFHYNLEFSDELPDLHVDGTV